MQRKPIYYFNDKDQTGIDDVPVDSYVILSDHVNQSFEKLIVLKTNSTIDHKTTISDYIINHSDLYYKDVSTNGTDGKKGDKGDPGASGINGSGVDISGVDSKANIIQKNGKLGEGWVETWSGHLFISDGKGVGTGHWHDVGLLRDAFAVIEEVGVIAKASDTEVLNLNSINIDLSTIVPALHKIVNDTSVDMTSREKHFHDYLQQALNSEIGVLAKAHLAIQEALVTLSDDIKAGLIGSTILKSPNGSKFKLTVSDTGSLTTTKI